MAEVSEKKAKLLMQKFRPGCDKLNRVMHKEEKVIALMKYIRDTYKHVEEIQYTENLTISGIFDEYQILDILSCCPSDENNNDATKPEVKAHMNIALCEYYEQGWACNV